MSSEKGKSWFSSATFIITRFGHFMKQKHGKSSPCCHYYYASQNESELEVAKNDVNPSSE